MEPEKGNLLTWIQDLRRIVNTVYRHVPPSSALLCGDVAVAAAAAAGGQEDEPGHISLLEERDVPVPMGDEEKGGDSAQQQTKRQKIALQVLHLEPMLHAFEFHPCGTLEDTPYDTSVGHQLRFLSTVKKITSFLDQASSSRGNKNTDSASLNQDED